MTIKAVREHLETARRALNQLPSQDHACFAAIILAIDTLADEVSDLDQRTGGLIMFGTAP